jgi:hypothetical protein
VSVYGKPEWPHGKDRGGKLGGISFCIDLETRATTVEREFADTRAMTCDRKWYEQNSDDIQALESLLKEANGEMTMADLKRAGADEIGKGPRQVHNIINRRNRFMPWRVDGACGKTKIVKRIPLNVRIEAGVAL